jgi:hypothetical protein
MGRVMDLASLAAMVLIFALYVTVHWARRKVRVK